MTVCLFFFFFFSYRLTKSHLPRARFGREAGKQELSKLCRLYTASGPRRAPWGTSQVVHSSVTLGATLRLLSLRCSGRGCHRARFTLTRGYRCSRPRSGVMAAESRQLYPAAAEAEVGGGDPRGSWEWPSGAPQLRDQRARGDELAPPRVPRPPDGTAGARSQ